MGSALSSRGRHPQITLDEELAIIRHDCFEHDLFADALLHNLEGLPAGSVVGIQAPWGRGKTDVLTRLGDKAKGSSAFARQAWLNPWRSPTDSMQPLVRVFAQHFQHSEDAPEALEVCQWLVGSAAGLPAYIRLELVKKCFGVESRKEGVFDSQDCLARFHKLTQKLVGEAKLLVCIDDLDRCPPGQQIPLLESYFFLTEGEQGPIFVLAYDLEILSASIRAHYGNVDPENYLDKIFDLRVSLPPITNSRQESKFLELCREADLANESRMLSAFFEAALDTRNPRMLARAFSKYRFACRTFDPEADASPDRFCLLVWLILTETWPDLRRQYQRLAREKSSADTPFVRLLSDAHTIIAHGGEQSDRNLFLAKLFQVTQDSAVNAGNIFIQVLARLNSGGKRRFRGEVGSNLKSFVDILCNEFQLCENVLHRAGL